MEKKIFDCMPGTWQELEEMVAQAFEEMGYETTRGLEVETVRGKVNVDVCAKKNDAPIPPVILCECKHWNQKVPQNVIHGFRTVCSDSGAHFGIIISKIGFQSGAEAAKEKTNLHLMNFQKFQETFFDEWWHSGIFMLCARMRDQLLPILRAGSGYKEHGLDIISKESLENLDIYKKYGFFFGTDHTHPYYGDFFCNKEISFPVEITDPRCSPQHIKPLILHSPRQLISVARQAALDATEYFNLPKPYFPENQEI